MPVGKRLDRIEDYSPVTVYIHMDLTTEFCATLGQLVFDFSENMIHLPDGTAEKPTMLI